MKLHASVQLRSPELSSEGAELSTRVRYGSITSGDLSSREMIPFPRCAGKRWSDAASHAELLHGRGS